MYISLIIFTNNQFLHRFWKRKWTHWKSHIWQLQQTLKQRKSTARHNYHYHATSHHHPSSPSRSTPPALSFVHLINISDEIDTLLHKLDAYVHLKYAWCDVGQRSNSPDMSTLYFEGWSLNNHRCPIICCPIATMAWLDSAVSINKFECPRREKRFYLCTDTSRSHGHYPIRSDISINKARTRSGRWRKTQHEKGPLSQRICSQTLMYYSVGHIIRNGHLHIK